MAQILIFRQLTTRLLTRSQKSVNLYVQSQEKLIHYCRTLQQRETDKKSSGGYTLQARNSNDDGQALSTDVRPLGEKIKEGTKTATYTAIILAGISVTGLMFWAIFRELFSSSSPNNIYTKAFNRVKDDVRVQDALGAPIKCYGEESRRGRRQHVAHTKYEREGIPHMRMQFYIQGLRNKATVQVETREANGKVEFRYLFVQLDYYPHTTIILEDNRAYDPIPASTTAANNADDYNNTRGLTLTSFNEK